MLLPHGYKGNRRYGIWIKDDIENRRNLRLAMSVFGSGELSWEDLQFLPGGTNFYIRNALALDILIHMQGLEGFTFDERLDPAKVAAIEKNKTSLSPFQSSYCK